MNNWRTAPRTIKAIFLFWIIQALLVTALFIWLVVEIHRSAEINPMIAGREYMFSMYADNFKTQPIETSIEVVLSLLILVGVYYVWSLLRGSARARSILETFSWIFVVLLTVNFLHPPDFSNLGLIIKLGILLLWTSVALGLRRRNVKNYVSASTC